MMLVQAIVEFFKYKVVHSIIVLTCSWSAKDQIKFIRELSRRGVTASVACEPDILANMQNCHIQGVLYVDHNRSSVLHKVQPEYFSAWYKWLVLGGDIPEVLQQIRYDADVTLLKLNYGLEMGNTASEVDSDPTLYFYDIYIHPKAGASLHPWARWSEGLHVEHEHERTLRRHDLKQHSLTMAAPVRHFDKSWYNGTFHDYLMDETMPEVDSGVRSGYRGSSLILQALNATAVLQQAQFWLPPDYNSSMQGMIAEGRVQLAGAILRINLDRIRFLDYILPIWPYASGFIYLAERASSTNMYVSPFSPGVWWSVLGVGILLVFVQRLTARRPEEKETAYLAVLATWLQQDATTVPVGASGRWSFLVLCVSSMLVHAYYTSAIVSSLMTTGMSGPATLEALADSKYGISSEPNDNFRALFFDVKSNWSGLEYLKKKKMTSIFYQNMEKGVELIREGRMAYHTEYNTFYPHIKTFSDEQLCKLQYVDTIPEVMTWITAPKRSQWTEVFRRKGAWMHETGLAKRVINQLKMNPAPCRSALLAERVKFGDVSPLLGLTVLGFTLAIIILGLEILLDKLKMTRKRTKMVEGQFFVEYKN